MTSPAADTCHERWPPDPDTTSPVCRDNLRSRTDVPRLRGKRALQHRPLLAAFDETGETGARKNANSCKQESSSDAGRLRRCRSERKQSTLRHRHAAAAGQPGRVGLSRSRRRRRRQLQHAPPPRRHRTAPTRPHRAPTGWGIPVITTGEFS